MLKNCFLVVLLRAFEQAGVSVLPGKSFLANSSVLDLFFFFFFFFVSKKKKKKPQQTEIPLV